MQGADSESLLFVDDAVSVDEVDAAGYTRALEMGDVDNAGLFTKFNAPVTDL